MPEGEQSSFSLAVGPLSPSVSGVRGEAGPGRSQGGAGRGWPQPCAAGTSELQSVERLVDSAEE